MRVLNELCEFRNEKISVNNISIENYVSTENLLPNKAGLTIASSLPSTEKVQSFRKGDVLVSNIRPYFKKIWLADQDGGCSNDVLVFNARTNVDSAYLYYVLSNDAFFDYATVTSKGTKMPRGDKKSIMQYDVPEYGILLQRKIGRFLKCIDDKITINSRINRNFDFEAA